LIRVSVTSIFFFAALGADLYEHFLHTSANNVFVVPPGGWTVSFDASVFILLALEILGCLFGILLLGGRTRNNSQPHFANH
jgi:intracellular septation protein A